MRTYYPLIVDLKFYFINDAEDVAVATYSFGSGKLPTDQECKQALEETLAKVPDGFKYCDYEEFMNEAVKEKTGINQRFAFTRLSDGVWWTEVK